MADVAESGAGAGADAHVSHLANTAGALPQMCMSGIDKEDARASLAARARLMSEFTPLLAQMKAASRGAYAQLADARSELETSRTQLGSKSITLHNLLYEREQLQAKITEANEMQTVYQDVPLLDMDEFKARAPEEYRTEKVLDDEHQLMVHRLQLELDERRR